VTLIDSRSSRLVSILSGFWLSVGLAHMALGQTQLAPSSAITQGPFMTMRARGTFEVKLTSQEPGDAADSALQRLAIAKQLHGDLKGSSRGQMLTAMTPVEGSAGYVAIERVSGTLHDRAGTFVLQHSGTMARGQQQLAIGVVPDSGTGELEGLVGRMIISIADGRHSYEFEYTLPAVR
jgi:hypothetical protein